MLIVSFIAVLSNAVVTECTGGCNCYAREDSNTETLPVALLCDYSQVSCIKSSIMFSLFWEVTQRGLVVIYRRFGAIYRSHLRDCLITEDGADSVPKRPKNNYQSTLRNIPEERRRHLHRIVSLKSKQISIILITGFRSVSDHTHVRMCKM